MSIGSRPFAALRKLEGCRGSRAQGIEEVRGMEQHPAIAPGNVAVITGAASGIGLAAARRLASLGMRIGLADLPGDALERAAEEVAEAARGGPNAVLAVPTDVGRREAVEQLRTRIEDVFGPVAL